MAKTLGKILLCSYFGFGLTFLIGSVLLLFVNLESWACFVVPPIVSAVLVFASKVRRKSSFILNFLQALAVAAGMAIHLGVFLLLGDTVFKPSVLFLGNAMSQAIPNLFIEFTSFMILANILGLVPAAFSALVVIQYVQSPGD